jgi:hypothetical protein
MIRHRVWVALGALLNAGAFLPLSAQQAQHASQVNPGLFAELRWRSIGPHRAGRTKAAAGHPSQPYTF